MNKKLPPKIIKTAMKKVTTRVASKNALKTTKIKVIATKNEVKAAGAKVMKKYSLAIKKLANR